MNKKTKVDGYSIANVFRNHLHQKRGFECRLSSFANIYSLDAFIRRYLLPEKLLNQN